ncbi:MAG: asparagine synthase-related protein [Clostridia bacterium]|nr:asparagine synthase-related protein [Clostridia bacterium]
MDVDMCIVLDLGGGQAASIARKVRGERVYCEVLPCDTDASRIIRRRPKGLIIAGGAGNPYSDGYKTVSQQVYELGIPMLGIGRGAGVILKAAGARLKRSMPGRQMVVTRFSANPLFEGLEDSERMVDRLEDITLPDDFTVIATEEGGWPVAFADDKHMRWAMEFYPEQNDPDGLRILDNFVTGICGCAPDWDLKSFMNSEMEYIRSKVADSEVLVSISGGVDSTVCACLMQRALNRPLKCLYVDTGLMRSGDYDSVKRVIDRMPGLELRLVQARDRFLKSIQGVIDPSIKREVINNEMRRMLEEYELEAGGGDCLARGTTYDDVMMGDEQAAYSEKEQLRQSFKAVIEPVNRLFKDEVRLLGELLGLPDELTRKQPFPGAGLALRCLGSVDERKLEMLRMADRIFMEEIASCGLDRRIRQYFAVLTDIKTCDEQNNIGYTLALRAVNWSASSSVAQAYRLPYDLLERVVERVTSEIEGVNRVVYDVTGKPPAGIEWD